ncbi:RING finger and transmembrane domain-containing protein 2 [Tyrophagus putrescentiae]|nr:RING finger and transmembrane domain-containing protein 2 [Tyrophagus putrescentiae]
MSKPLKLGQSSPLDKHARRDILHSFRCPRDCRDFEDAYASIIGCPFGHYDLARKKVLPSFVCVPYLLDECPKKMTSDQLLFCEDGFHLADRDLLDLEQFTKRMADYVLQRGPLESKPEFELTGTTSLECCICFAPFNGIYGQLSDCTHVFCAKCITDWFKKERNCPVCRKSSRFIIAWHGLIASKGGKGQDCSNAG